MGSKISAKLIYRKREIIFFHMILINRNRMNHTNELLHPAGKKKRAFSHPASLWATSIKEAANAAMANDFQ